MTCDPPSSFPPAPAADPAADIAARIIADYTAAAQLTTRRITRAASPPAHPLPGDLWWNYLRGPGGWSRWDGHTWAPCPPPAPATGAERTLAAAWALRTGGTVTVYPAAEPVTAGQYVTLTPDGQALPASPASPTAITGIALADAHSPGSTVLVGLPAAAGFRGGQPPPHIPGGPDGELADVVFSARIRGENITAAVEAYRRRLAPLTDLPPGTVIVVAPGPGPCAEAWRMIAAGVWIARAGEPAADWLPADDPARPETMTAGQLRDRLTA